MSFFFWNPKPKKKKVQKRRARHELERKNDTTTKSFQKKSQSLGIFFENGPKNNQKSTENLLQIPTTHMIYFSNLEFVCRNRILSGASKAPNHL